MVPRNQSGSALAISLVILTAITLISVTSLQRSGLQTKIVANIQHKEQLFHSASSDQEFWFTQLRDSISGDSLLTAPLRSFVIDPLGNKQFSAVPLNGANPRPNIQTTNSIVHLPPETGGRIALAQGEESGQRINYRFTLDSSASTVIGNKQNTQQSGISFPGLNPSAHSLN